MNNILDSKKAIDILIYLYKKDATSYGSEIGHDLRITYSHISRLIKFLLNEELISCIKEGRISYITLTKEGKNIAKNLTEIEKTKV